MGDMGRKGNLFIDLFIPVFVLTFIVNILWGKGKS